METSRFGTESQNELWQSISHACNEFQGKILERDEEIRSLKQQLQELRQENEHLHEAAPQEAKDAYSTTNADVDIHDGDASNGHNESDAQASCMSRFVSLLEYEKMLAERDEIKTKHDLMKTQRTHDRKHMKYLDGKMTKYQGKFRRAKLAIKDWQSYLANYESNGMLPLRGFNSTPVPAVETIKSFCVNSPSKKPRLSDGDKNTTSSPLKNLESAFAADEHTSRNTELVQHGESVASTTDACSKGNALPVQNGDAVPSSQTTDELIPDETPPTKPQVQPTATASSPPVIIKERSLKRKRTNNDENERAAAIPRYGDPECGTNAKPIEIKEEGSSPVGLAAILDARYMDSIDLDEIPEPIVTPRKRKHFQRLRSNLVGPSFIERYAPPHLGQEKSNSQPDEEEEFQDLGNYGLDQQRFTRSFDGATFEAVGGGSIANSPEPWPSAAEPVLAQQRHEDRIPLRQINRNRRPMPRDNLTTRYAKRRRRPEEDAKKAAMLTEDGEELAPAAAGHRDDYGAAETNHSRTPGQVQAGISTGRRLTALLESSPTKPKPVTPKTMNSDRTHPQPTFKKPPNPPPLAAPTPAQGPPTSAPAKPAANLPNSSRTTTRPPNLPRRSLNANTYINPTVNDPLPKHNPNTHISAGGPHPAFTNPAPRLRDRPLSTLQLTDFRVNPRANAGLPFPFQETIRGHARGCLPGCTLPECCGGELRRMLEIAGGDIPAARMGAAEAGCGSAEDSKEAEEDRLLIWHLGDEDEAARLSLKAIERESRRAGPRGAGNHVRQQLLSERREAVLTARVARLAHAHGKHRNRFERRRTPPGFWETDMPSSQEFRAQREWAVQESRRKVEERWREAVRGDEPVGNANGAKGGGRGPRKWVFRDEVV
ncbi:MAG: hypothetical protein M1831_007004 [Alyxoria varia]|nr:MAG: hypothetical protein M1831_007004 [Alyxoria varia]